MIANTLHLNSYSACTAVTQVLIVTCATPRLSGHTPEEATEIYKSEAHRVATLLKETFCTKMLTELSSELSV